MKKFKIMVNIKVSPKIYLAFTIIINNLEKNSQYNRSFYK